MNNIKRSWRRIACCAALVAILGRAYSAIHQLSAGDETAFLAFPLSVILPSLAFAYVLTLRDMVSEEGALMQLGVLIQLVLILALPSFALYLALGFPVVFLVVELFETKCPPRLRSALKARILA